MFDIKRKTIEWAGRPLTLETGRIARQADGAVLATYGGTVVLATAVFNKSPKAGVDFFPLTVNYQEKTFAAGKIPGGYFKREGRPSELETLTSRLIDRPLRPLFVPICNEFVAATCPEDRACNTDGVIPSANSETMSFSDSGGRLVNVNLSCRARP